MRLLRCRRGGVLTAGMGSLSGTVCGIGCCRLRVSATECAEPLVRGVIGWGAAGAVSSKTFGTGVFGTDELGAGALGAEALGRGVLDAIRPAAPGAGVGGAWGGGGGGGDRTVLLGGCCSGCAWLSGGGRVDGVAYVLKRGDGPFRDVLWSLEAA